MALSVSSATIPPPTTPSQWPPGAEPLTPVIPSPPLHQTVRLLSAMSRESSAFLPCLCHLHTKPYLARPLKNLPMAMTSSWSEQLNTTVWMAKALPRSFVVSVFPVPAGPAGAPPNLRCRAPVRVR